MSISQKFRPQTAEKHLKNDIVLNIISKKKQILVAPCEGKPKVHQNQILQDKEKTGYFHILKNAFFSIDC